MLLWNLRCAGSSATKGGKNITRKHCTMQILCHVLSTFWFFSVNIERPHVLRSSRFISQLLDYVTSSDWPPERCHLIYCKSWSLTLQPVVYLSCCVHLQLYAGHFIHKNAVRDNIKSFSKIQNILVYCFPFVYWSKVMCFHIRHIYPACSVYSVASLLVIISLVKQQNLSPKFRSHCRNKSLISVLWL